MDCKSMRADCCVYMFIHYATALLRLGFFPLPFSCPSHQSEYKHPMTFEHTSPYLFTSKYQCLTTNWKWKFSKTHKLWGLTSSRCENSNEKKERSFCISCPTGLLPTRSFTIYFLHLTLSALHTSSPSSAPASVCFLSPVELNKSQHCKIHMMSSGNVDMRK